MLFQSTPGSILLSKDLQENSTEPIEGKGKEGDETGDAKKTDDKTKGKRQNASSKALEIDHASRAGNSKILFNTQSNQIIYIQKIKLQ